MNLMKIVLLISFYLAQISIIKKYLKKRQIEKYFLTVLFISNHFCDHRRCYFVFSVMCVCIYINIYTYMCMFVYIYIYIYIYIYYITLLLLYVLFRVFFQLFNNAECWMNVSFYFTFLIYSFCLSFELYDRFVFL